MLASKEKISLRQAVVIVTTIMYIPAIKGVPIYTAAAAKQAAWLSPVVTLVIFLPIVLMFNSIFKKYKEESFMEVAEDIFGTILGKILTVIYIVLLTLILTVDARDSADRLVSSIYPNVNIAIFIAVMLFTVAVILRKGGIVVLARMSEIIVIVLVFIFLSISVLAIKNISVSRITPISPLDIQPILKSNLAVAGIWAHFPFIFLLSNFMNDKEKINKYCIPVSFLQAFLLMLLIIISIGSLGASIVEISLFPYLSAVKIISLFGFLERIDALVVGSWIFSDFILISVMLLTVLNLYKSLLKLSDIKPLTGIYAVIIFFLTFLLARNSFELAPFAEFIFYPGCIILGFVIPVMVFVVGKLRKKI
jgi:spore germination protein (amino acid permease)